MTRIAAMPRALPTPIPALAIAAALAAGPMAGAALEAQLPSQAAAHVAQYALSGARDSTSRDPELDAAGRRYAATVRHCYQEQGLKGDPALSGLLRVEMTVLPAGDVRDATATASRVIGTGMPAVATCVSTAARTWRFRDGAPRTERVVLWFDLLPPSP